MTFLFGQKNKTNIKHINLNLKKFGETIKVWQIQQKGKKGLIILAYFKVEITEKYFLSKQQTKTSKTLFPLKET